MKSRSFLNVSDKVKQLTAAIAKTEAERLERARKRGVRWCKRCHRVHGRDGCRLVPVRVAMNNGSTRIHWVHPERLGRPALIQFGEDVAT